MTIRHRSLFTITFAAVTLLEMLGDTLAIRWVHYGCKPLIMGLLLYYVWQQGQSGMYSKSIRWLTIGMVFALLGDIFLMIQEVDLFAPGLGAFLVMQVCYCLLFRQSVRDYGQLIVDWRVWLATLAFIVYLVGFLFVLRPSFARNPGLQALCWPVVIYAICLNTMGLLAVLRRGSSGYGWVATGAILFILSDSAIAVDKFLQPGTGLTWFIMSTYAAAQYLIVVGMVKHVLTCRQPV